MFTNSLFSDYIRDHGLKIWKDDSTRDIICLEFNYGTKSYEEEISRLRELGRKARLEYKMSKASGNASLIEKKYEKRARIGKLFLQAQNNRDKYEKHSKEEIRDIAYNEGVTVEYVTQKKKGETPKKEAIHYQMLFRSTGKAKIGYCMFICDRLYKRAHDFLYMGIKMPKSNAPIVEASAYVPLIASSVIDRIQIDPRNILILRDIDKYFDTSVVSVETDSERHCYTKHLDNYRLKNTLFDGQALIDTSIFPSWGNGYILLRHHFCKMAAFHANIQQFFKDYYQDGYETATVQDMFGNTHFVKDVQVITTENSMKWIKFGKSYDYWCKKVNENDCMFGIVKTAHESKLGDVQRMSYQMVNSLDESIMPDVVRESVSYVELLKKDDDEFLKYLDSNKGFANDYDVLIALCEQDPEFKRSSYFRRRKSDIIHTYVMNMKNGKLLQNAENLVVVGSPYAMLLYGATGDPSIVDKDITFYQEEGTIQCYTERFNSGEYLAFFRSPFNSKNNLMYLHNTYHQAFEKYFHLGRQTIAINMIGTDAQDRSNGMDMDSDFGYTTNQPDIVEHARKCYKEYPTIVNNIPKEKTKYGNTPSDYAKMDNSLANSQRDIGESSNLAQIAQTYSCNFTDQKYIDYVCILSVIAQAAIDNAKRRFDIDISAEIRRIKNDMDIREKGYPAFWSIIRKDFDKSRINYKLHCPMNYLANVRIQEFHPSSPTLPMQYFFVRYDTGDNYYLSRKVEELLSKYLSIMRNYDFVRNGDTGTGEALAVIDDFDKLVEEIGRIKMSKHCLGLFSWLIDRAFLITPKVKGKEEKIEAMTDKNKSLLLKALYKSNPENLLKCFSKNCS